MTAGSPNPAVDLTEVVNLALELLARERCRLVCARCDRAIAELGGYSRHPRRSFCRRCADALDLARGTGAA